MDGFSRQFRRSVDCEGSADHPYVGVEDSQDLLQDLVAVFVFENVCVYLHLRKGRVGIAVSHGCLVRSRILWEPGMVDLCEDVEDDLGGEL